MPLPIGKSMNLSDLVGRKVTDVRGCFVNACGEHVFRITEVVVEGDVYPIAVHNDIPFPVLPDAGES